jgi:NAD(P)-dependent dehydrogenase (short-subunit alcohol dehydrogenase family)
MEQKNQKKVVITGGNNGIGMALAQLLLDQQYQVTITLKPGQSPKWQHPHLKTVALEITDAYSIAQAAKTLEAECGGIDILVNCAGVATDAYFIIPEYESFKRTIDVNLTGLVFFNEAVLGLVSKGGHIINVSSDMGLLSQADTNGPAYRISKAALNMYTKMLALRMRETGIRVTAVHPGWVRTNVGGADAPMDTTTSAEGIYGVIMDTKRNGEFRNIANDDCFLL